MNEQLIESVSAKWADALHPGHMPYAGTRDSIIGVIGNAIHDYAAALAAQQWSDEQSVEWPTCAGFWLAKNASGTRWASATLYDPSSSGQDEIIVRFERTVGYSHFGLSDRGYRFCGPFTPTVRDASQPYTGEVTPEALQIEADRQEEAGNAEGAALLRACAEKWRKGNVLPFRDGETWLLGAYRHHDRDLVSVIAAMSGWNPLQVNENMTVHFSGKQYMISRLHDQT